MTRRYKTWQNRLFDGIVYLVMVLVLLICLVPFIYMLAISFSSTSAIVNNEVFLWPVGFTAESYKQIFEYPKFFHAYGNTFFYTIVGTAISLVMTILFAYPLSKPELFGQKFLMKMVIFSMYFSGGLIPNYLLVKDLNLLNTPWALWLPGLISVYNVIVMRTFFQTTIPKELLEAAQIDGCTNRRFLWSVVLPLSKTILAVMVLLYAIGHWNSYFNAMLYISDKQKWPLQIFLREILIANQIDMTSMTGSSVQEMMRRQELQTLLKYALIVVASVPVLVVYPFVQKHLVKGVMIGSVKG